jgi:hypothetical protein
MPAQLVDWYAACMGAREPGSTPDEASKAAGRYMANSCTSRPYELIAAP